MPNRRLEQRRTRLKRFVATILATVYLCGSEGPMLLTLAAPGWFVRPGAGVSSQPLAVSSFDAPGFGELAQAVNLANGNVYAAAGGLSFNNQMTSGDENTNKVGGSGWNLTSRLRLNGFSRTAAVGNGLNNIAIPPANYVFCANETETCTFVGTKKVAFGTNGAYVYQNATGSVACTTAVFTDPVNGFKKACFIQDIAGTSSTIAGPTGFVYCANETGTCAFAGTRQVAFGAAGSYNYKSATASTACTTTAFGGDPKPNTAKACFFRDPPSDFGLDNLTVEQNIASSYYGPHWMKPNVLPVNRFSKPVVDTGCSVSGTPAYASGVIRDIGSPVAPGTYRVAVDLRADAALQGLFGLSDYKSQVVNMTTSWQRFTADFTIAAGENFGTQAGRLFEVRENVQNNVAWEVANISVQKMTGTTPGPNLITAPMQDTRSSYWLDYCNRPPTEVFYRLQKADYTGTPGANYSGIVRTDTFLNGTYKVSLQARTRNGSLAIQYGVNDSYLQAATLTTSWQSLSKTFNVTANQLDRVFEVIEGTANNPDWEVKNISVQRIAPGSFTLSSGDGSSTSFKQTTPNFATVPSWISRYQNATGTTFYALEARPGTQYVREWVVLRQIGANYVAHYYTPDGTRVTFDGDGEYADYVQNPHQQYQSASLGYPEGRDAGWTTPRTEIWYTSQGSGLISQVMDAWGRTTTYEWNTTDKTLTKINELLQTVGNNATAARTTTFEYNHCWNGVCGNQRAISKVTYTAPDGKGGLSSRWTTFSYEWRNKNSRFMLKNISRNVLGGSSTLQTTYNYDDATDRLTRVDMTDQPSIHYNFAMTGTLFVRNNNLPVTTLSPSRTTQGLEYRAPTEFATDLYEVRLTAKQTGKLEWSRNGRRANPVQLTRGQRATLGRFTVRPGDRLELRGAQGAKVQLVPLMAVAGPVTTQVTVWQSPTTSGDVNRKESKFTFDASGQLTKKEVRDYNPWAAQNSAWFSHSPPEKWLTTEYTYNATGTTASVLSPAGRKDAYTYDASGSLTKLETFMSAAATTPERSTSFTYDLENRRTGETIAATSGSRAGASYDYLENKQTSSYTLHPTVTTGGQTFTALSGRTDSRVIGGSTKRSYTESYDTAGRLTQKTTASSGLVGVTTDFYYHNSVTTWQPYLPGLEGTYATLGTAVKQYGDLVWQISNGLQTRNYYYDAFGNANWERTAGALYADGSLTVNQSGGELRVPVARFRTWNGFGQPVWDTLYEDEAPGRTARYLERKIWNYYATGELDSSWSGERTNTTDYTYTVSGWHLGRVAGFTRGVGDGSGVSTVRETTTLGYDDFGRVTTKTVDGFATTITYDTLDRVVHTVLPNGAAQAASYHMTGIQDFNCDHGGGGSGSSQPAQPDQNRCTYQVAIDTLGRPAQTNLATNLAFTRITYLTYDPFDRPIKVVNDALVMVPAGDARATFIKYDSEGRVTKHLGPELGSSGYTDSRRPYTEFEYDNFGRKTFERKLTRSASPVTPSSMTFPGDASVARTQWLYDQWGRVYSVEDADGWWTGYSRDPLGNVTEKKQLVCWSTTDECGEHFSDEDSNTGDRYATTFYAYDAVGRVTVTVDARKNVSRTVYNAFGQPQYIVDARNKTTKAMNYTGDGLVSSIFEPDNNTGTAASLADDGNAGGYLVTKSFNYGSRRFPTSSCVHGINNNLYPCTSYVYDFAGRPTLTTLPDNATIEQAYNGRGQLTRLKDADGFVTEYQYDAWGQLIQEKKPPRTSNTSDQTAFPAGFAGLTNSYVYDLAGNLTKKTERGLYTDYYYNTSGKVQVETRPRKPGANPYFKYYTYRVDGVKTAETSYDYSGNLVSSQYNTVNCSDNTPNVAAGSAKCWADLTALGRAGSMASFGVSASVAGGASARESIEVNLYNGLGLRYKRSFYGSTEIYATHKLLGGGDTGVANYATLFRYDANGNLLKSYKRAISGNGGAYTDAPGDASDVFNYAYTATNKQKLRSSEVRVWSGGAMIGRTAGGGGDSNASNCPSQPPAGVATPQAVTSLCYNERDQVGYVVVNDADARGGTVARSTAYGYYQDGSKSAVSTGTGSLTYTYDTRGRLTQVVDSNGVNGVGGPITSSFTYGSDGTVTESLNNGAYSSTRKPTVGGLIYQVSGAAAPGINGCPTGTGGTVLTSCPLQQTTQTYDGDGQLTRRVWTQTTQTLLGTATRTIDTEFFNDVYGNNNSRFETSSGSEYIGGSSPTNRSIARRQVYSAAFSIINAVTSETINPTNGGSSVTHNFALTARGLRLNMTGTDTTNPFHNGVKRYDADDRTAEVNSSVLQNVPTDQGPPGTTMPATVTQAMRFKYDPFGELALSANAQISDYGSGLLHEQTKSSSSVLLDGRVLLMHTQRFSGGYRPTCTQEPNEPPPGTHWECYATYSPGLTTSLDQDESFSLADGVKDGDPAFDIIAPFSAPFQNTTALQAPVTPLSSQVNVEPSAIQAPGSTLPSSNPGEITPPQPSSNAEPQSTGFSSGTSLTQSTGVSSQSVSSPALGVQSFSISSATTNATTQPSTTASGNQTQSFSSQINLEAPSSVLPPSITPLSASSITAPSSLTLVTPNAGEVSSIVAPGSGVPVVGISPSGGSSSIVPPSGSVSDPSSGVVPPGSSGAIVPPGGTATTGSSDATVKPFGATYVGGVCTEIEWLKENKCTPSKTLQAERKKLEDKIEAGNGTLDDKTRVQEINLQLNLRTMYSDDAIADGHYQRMTTDSALYQRDLSPAQKLHWLQTMNRGISEKVFDKKDIESVVRFMEQCRVGASPNPKLRAMISCSDSRSNVQNTAFAFLGALGVGCAAALPVCLGAVGIGIIVMGVVLGVAAYNDLKQHQDSEGFLNRSESSDSSNTSNSLQSETDSTASLGDPNDPCDPNHRKDAKRAEESDHAGERGEERTTAREQNAVLRDGVQFEQADGRVIFALGDEAAVYDPVAKKIITWLENFSGRYFDRKVDSGQWTPCL
jgi:YD repeat-containing protein